MDHRQSLRRCCRAVGGEAAARIHKAVRGFARFIVKLARWLQRGGVVGDDPALFVIAAAAVRTESDVDVALFEKQGRRLTCIMSSKRSSYRVFVTGGDHDGACSLFEDRS